MTNMSSEIENVRILIEELARNFSKSKVQLTANEIGISLRGMSRMNSNHKEVTTQ